MNKYTSVLVATFVGFLTTTANATPILCETVTNNHMFMDDSVVSACVDAGSGNINGNVLTDDFLTAGGTAAGYVDAGVTGFFTDNGKDGDGNSSGTWSITSSVDAIGFKFGTGNQPDEWFVFDLVDGFFDSAVDGVYTANWSFINVFGTGGGLSHLQTYNKTSDTPEPGIVALLAVGLLGMVAVRRKKTA